MLQLIVNLALFIPFMAFILCTIAFAFAMLKEMFRGLKPPPSGG